MRGLKKRGSRLRKQLNHQVMFSCDRTGSSRFLSFITWKQFKCLMFLLLSYFGEKLIVASIIIFRERPWETKYQTKTFICGLHIRTYSKTWRKDQSLYQRPVTSELFKAFFSSFFFLMVWIKSLTNTLTSWTQYMTATYTVREWFIFNVESKFNNKFIILALIMHAEIEQNMKL